MSKDFKEDRRGGVLVAESDPTRLHQMVEALRESGFSVVPMTEAWELTDLLEDAAFGGDRSNLVEVFVISADMLNLSGIDLLASFEAVGCADSLIVVVDAARAPGPLTRYSQTLPCLQWPFPMSMLVGEVAAMASATSITQRARPLLADPTRLASARPGAGGYGVRRH